MLYMEALVMFKSKTHGSVNNEKYLIRIVVTIMQLIKNITLVRFKIQYLILVKSTAVSNVYT